MLNIFPPSDDQLRVNGQLSLTLMTIPLFTCPPPLWSISTASTSCITVQFVPPLSIAQAQTRQANHYHYSTIRFTSESHHCDVYLRPTHGPKWSLLVC